MSVRLTGTFARKPGTPGQPGTEQRGGRVTLVCPDWDVAVATVQGWRRGAELQRVTITELELADRNYRRSTAQGEEKR